MPRTLASWSPVIALAAAWVSCSLPHAGFAQWLDAPPANAPRLPNGEVDLEAPPPKHPNGRVDLQGVWMPDDNRYIRDLALDIGDDNVPYQPWARRLFDERKDGLHSGEDPDAHCLPQGVPKLGYVSYPWKLVETPTSVVILYETFTFWRQIFTDGRTVDPTAKPAWMGYSTGRWDGDTLVVTTTGFNGKSWLDQLGRPTTDRLTVTERFTRTHYGHMRIDVTIDDRRRVHGAVVGVAGRASAAGMGAARVCLRREQQGRRESARGRWAGDYEYRGGEEEGISRVGAVGHNQCEQSLLCL